MRMRQFFGPMLITALLVGSMSACAGARKATLYLFYEAVCPACEEYSRMRNLSSRVAWIAQQSRSERAEIHDVYEGDGMKRLEEVCSEYGVKPETLSLPVLFAGGKIYAGEATIVDYLKSREK